MKMSHRKKELNIVQLLQKRECNPGKSAYRISLKMIRGSVLSKDTIFRQNWCETSNTPIVYEGGHFYLNHNTHCFTLYGPECKTKLSYVLTPKGKITNVVAYLSPVTKDLHDPNSNNIPICKYLISITKNSWLYQSNWETGKTMTEVYIKPFNESMTFMHCDWNTYSEQIILTSGLNPKDLKNYKSDVVATMAVFDTRPFEYVGSLDIKRSVFGKNCFHANVSDQMLILGMGSQAVRIYSFTEMLKEGNIHPYKLGDDYPPHGKVGEYPVGLPLNITINSAPTILFEVQGYDHMVNFGGYPFYYLYMKIANDTNFILKSLADNRQVKNGVLQSKLWLSDSDYAVYFHPDGSNRILQKTTSEVQCYKIVNDGNNSELKKIYTMKFPEERQTRPKFSSFGRKLTNSSWQTMFERHVLATDYDDELELFAILGTQPNDSLFSSSSGFVKLYETATGKEVKSLDLEQNLCDSHRYDLYLDLDSIIIIERDLKNTCKVYVYTLLHTII